MKKIFAASIFLFGFISLQAQMQFQIEVPTPQNKVAAALSILQSQYIDEVDSDKLAEEAIIAMLKTLDPHSSYSDPEETKELTTPLDGNFSGIGIQFNMVNDTLMVIQTTAGGPSEKVGMLAGDKILSADGEPISGAKKSNADIIKKLRGPKGTTVKIEVARRGVARPILFNITRDDIPINSIDAAFMIDPTTGYIKMSRFGETTEREFVEALQNLQAEGMKNLIVDLEDNGGGYLGSAIGVANHLLPKGSLVTYTEAPRERQPKFPYYAQSGDGFIDGRLVVMVNQNSASASEILSGAVQDHDRGLIVGRRTFGKGLVQRPYPFSDGSMIRLTVSRYHTPSGRSIQKPYKAGEADEYRMDMKHRYDNGEFYSADNIVFPDSLTYYTLANHRKVYGGGGIMPDRFVPVDTTAYSDYYRDIVAKGVLNRFCLTYVDDNRAKLKKDYPDETDFINRFEVSKPMIDRLVAMAEKDSIAPNPEQLERSLPIVNSVIKALIGRDMFDSATYYKIMEPTNPVFRAAVELINDPRRYDALLLGVEASVE